MTTEELAAAGILPTEEEVQEPEIAQPREDIRDVDADLKDLVAAK
jgi:hypothetical protein